jgi:hypothetical protein
MCESAVGFYLVIWQVIGEPSHHICCNIYLYLMWLRRGNKVVDGERMHGDHVDRVSADSGLSHWLLCNSSCSIVVTFPGHVERACIHVGDAC